MYGLIWLLNLMGIFLTIQGSILIVEPREESLRRHKGSDVTLRCMSTNGEALLWYHHDNLLHQNHRRTVTNLPLNSRNQRISTLHIRNLREADSGVISCRTASRHDGHDDVILVVTNHNHIPTVEIVEPNSSVLRRAPGEDIMLKCEAKQGQRLEWLHNGTVLQRGSKLIITDAHTLSNRRTSIMSRLSARAHDAGIYECRNQDNALDKDVVTVLIQSAPSSNAGVEITIPPTPYLSISPDTSLHIKCTASSGTQVRWYRNDRPIRNGEHGFSIDEQFDELKQAWMSRLTRPRADSDAIYKCQNVHNTLDFDVVQIHVNDSRSIGPPGNLNDYRIPRSLETVRMSLYSSLRLQCSIKAEGTYTTEWTKDNRTIHVSDKYSTTIGNRASTLTIRRTGRGDTGLYQCLFTDTESGQPSGAIVYNVTATLCPPLVSSASFRLEGCPGVQYVGERCRIVCNHGNNDGVSRQGMLSCLYDEVRRVAYWTSASQICNVRRSIQGAQEDDIPFSLSHVLLRANENLRLQCGRSRVTWVKASNHVPLQNNNKYQIDRGRLIIKNAGASDEGLYICKLYSQDDVTVFGHKKYNVTVMPCTRPEAPARGDVIGCSANPVYGETCEYTCHAGSKLVSGNKYSTCELTALETETYWTGHPPLCQSLSQSDSFQENDTSAANTRLCHHVVLLWTALTLAFYLYS